MYFEEAFKLRNVLEEVFEEFLKLRRGQQKPTILGPREGIFTGSSPFKCGRGSPPCYMVRALEAIDKAGQFSYLSNVCRCRSVVANRRRRPIVIASRLELMNFDLGILMELVNFGLGFLSFKFLYLILTG